MMIGFFGSRYCKDYYTILSCLKSLKAKFSLTVVTGDCIGVDELTYKACKQLGIPVKVFKVKDNPTGYDPEPQDILETIDSPRKLSERLAKRTIKFINYIAQHRGFLIGYQVDGSGSQLAIRTAKQLNIPVYIIDPVNRQLIRL